MTLPPILSIALGGALGAVLRYLCVTWVERSWHSPFPVAILSINVVGSFLMGLAFVLLGRLDLGPWALFLMTGVLGGFTTFSAFSLEAVSLWQNDQMVAAVLYVGLSVCGAICGLLSGLWCGRSLAVL